MGTKKKRARRSFTPEYKAEVVALVRSSGKTVAAIANELDLTVSAVRSWVQQADADAGRGAPGAPTTAELEELRKLRKEVQVLRMERDLLKKAAQFFAKEHR